MDTARLSLGHQILLDECTCLPSANEIGLFSPKVGHSGTDILANKFYLGKIHTIPILMHQMSISIIYISSMMLRHKKRKSSVML
jgi:hypothetical protein